MDQPPSPKNRELKQRTRKRERGGETVARSDGELAGSADRRTMLAGDRTTLAFERTYAAWVRTALGAMASGVGARALMRDFVPGWVGKATGTVLVIFAGFCLVAAVWRELQGEVLKSGENIRPIPQLVLLPMNGLLMLVAIAVLVAIWAS